VVLVPPGIPHGGEDAEMLGQIQGKHFVVVSAPVLLFGTSVRFASGENFESEFSKGWKKRLESHLPGIELRRDPVGCGPSIHFHSVQVKFV
jgi:hypothetical protein